MSRSEIDDIFAASGPPPKKKSKAPSTEQQKAPSKSRHPETVFDPSRKQVLPERRREKKHAKPDNARFTDSRGSASRRKTADGYNIYKEDELGISTTGGDTSLCPFDCQCCF